MGCCASKDAPPKGKLQRKADTTIQGPVTGIMDEEAPLTTAPKLNVMEAGLEGVVEKLIDVMQGEQIVINDRIPEKEETSRLFIYEQLLLTLREVVHNLNESCLLGVDQLPPSHVMDLIADARIKSAPVGPVPLPAPHVRKAPPCPVFKTRSKAMSAWLQTACKHQTPDIPYDALLEFHKLAELRTPIHQILMDKPGATTYTYKDICNSSILYMRENLKWLRQEYDSVCNGGMLTKENFVKLMEKNMDRAEAEMQFTEMLTVQELQHRQEGKWTFREFWKFMFSKDNQGLDPRKTKMPYHDMTRPITEYHICTSAYSWLLTSDQLTSDSSVEMLETVLAFGCRSIELGLCDGPDGEPVVQLAWTKNRHLLLTDCLKAIAQSAFVKTDYPLVLSVSLHFGTESDSRQQMEKTGGYFKEYLGQALQMWGADFQPPEMSEVTPEALKGKILLECEKRWHEVAKEARAGLASPVNKHHEIVELGMNVVNVKARIGVKIVTISENSPADVAGLIEGAYIEAIAGKPVKSVAELQAILQAHHEDEIKIRVNQRDYKIIQSKTPRFPPVPPVPASPVYPPDNMFASNGFDESIVCVESSDEEKPEALKRWKQMKIAAKMKAGTKYKKLPVEGEVSAMVYLKKAGRKAENFHDESRWWEVINVAPKVILSNQESLEKVHADSNQQLYRVHPPRASLNSENVDPTPLWDAGVQLVGGFFHHFDEPLSVHLANFADNGSCGWLNKSHAITQQGSSLSLTVHSFRGARHSLGEDVDGYIIKCYSTRDGKTYDDFDASAPSEFCSWDKTYTFDVTGEKQFIIIALATEHQPSVILARAAARPDLLRPGLRCLPAMLPDTPVTQNPSESCFLCTIEFS
eukprot:TRINITY_DN993_c0_g2_i1.p1 TRINITY_DN993_c0_g2~~TRINITY_DN993_c0_g2_i1.p1  ORF type:complete len:865 (+),score=253.10 TRINITY_DN993_c0_g2_i1:53-2647(+)